MIFMTNLYTTTAVSTGGRAGKVVVENSALAFDMSPPAEMGGTGTTGVNPEQLFAAGYSACFGSALQHVIRTRKLHVAVPTVQLTVGIGKNDAGGFALSAAITATFTGVDQALADELLQEAHMVCPYSNATRGNMDVALTAKVQ
jgi:lipoyl-dependent peroxiredoxin